MQTVHKSLSFSKLACTTYFFSSGNCIHTYSSFDRIFSFEWKDVFPICVVSCKLTISCKISLSFNPSWNGTEPYFKIHSHVKRDQVLH